MISKMLKLFILTLVFTSCATDLFKESITIENVVSAKETIANSNNPAKQMVLKNNLSQKIIKIENALVKDIVQSPNVDYNFCVIVNIKSSKGNIECYVFTKNIRRISMLKKNKSRINIKGNFGRYFSMLDDFYTKIEILNSTIDIVK